MGVDRPTSDAEKRSNLQKLLLLCSRDREQAIEYLDHDVRATIQNPDTPQIGFRCPKENVQCKTVEFDNIKVFYHPTWPEHPVSVGDTWNFYIARPGASPRDCIDWAEEGIEVEAKGLDGQWEECQVLLATPGARVRISYPFKSELRTCEIVFPVNDPSTHTIHLEYM